MKLNLYSLYDPEIPFEFQKINKHKNTNNICPQKDWKN